MSNPLKPSSFSALCNGYGLSSSLLMFVFSIAFFQMCCCCLSFEKLHRLSRGGGALLGHSLHLAVTHLFPWCSPKGGEEFFPQSGWDAGAGQKLHSWDHSLQAWGGLAQPQVEIVFLHLPHLLHTKYSPGFFGK